MAQARGGNGDDAGDEGSASADGGPRVSADGTLSSAPAGHSAAEASSASCRRVLDVHQGLAAEVFLSRNGRWLISRGTIDGIKVTDVERGTTIEGLASKQPWAELAYAATRDLAAYSACKPWG